LGLGYGPGELEDLKFGMHGACGIEPSAKFSVEPFNEVRRSQESPKALGLLEETDMVVEAAGNELDGFGVTGSPSLLEPSEGFQGVIPAGGPEDGVEIGQEGFPVGFGHAGLDVAKQVNDAKLMRSAEEVFGGGFDAFVLVGNKEADGLWVEAAGEKVFDERLPTVLGLPIAEEDAEDMPLVVIVDAQGDEEGLLGCESRATDGKHEGIKEKIADACGIGRDSQARRVGSRALVRVDTVDLESLAPVMDRISWATASVEAPRSQKRTARMLRRWVPALLRAPRSGNARLPRRRTGRFKLKHPQRPGRLKDLKPLQEGLPSRRS
jgi:hypothetical protein